MIFFLMFLRTMAIFNFYIKFYFTFLVVLEKHETSPKLLCYYFKMASEACSFVPSGACRSIGLDSLEPLAGHYQSHGISSMKIVMKMTGLCVSCGYFAPGSNKERTARANHLPVSTQSSPDNNGAVQEGTVENNLLEAERPNSFRK
jgi:hypothetical protein